MFLAVLVSAGAQQMNKQIGAENKKYSSWQIDEMIIVGKYDSLTIGVTKNYKSIAQNVQVIAFDDNMNMVHSVDIPDTKLDHAEMASIFEGKIYILIFHYKKWDGSYEYNRAVLDAKTLTLIGEPNTVFSYKHKSSEEHYLWASQSPDGLLAAIIDISVVERKDKYAAVEILLDEEMNIEWQRDYPIYWLSNMMVTNDGEIITLGRSKGKGANKIYFSVIDQNNGIDISQQTSVAIEKTDLICYRDNKILAVGFGNDPENKREIKYFGISADTKTSTVNIDYKTVTNNDKCVFDGVDLGKKLDPRKNYYLKLKNCKETDYGAVATLVNYPNKYDINIVGMLVFAIDKNGSIIWNKMVRNNLFSKYEPTKLFYALCVEGSDTYLVGTESHKGPATYTVDKKINKQNLNSGGKGIAIYHFDANGSVTKKLDILDKPMFFGKHVKKIGDEYVGFITTVNGVSMIKFRF